LLTARATATAGEPRDRRWLARQGALAFGLTGLTLGVNLVTGVIVARGLGPDGRGALAAVVAAMSVTAWLVAMGGRQAVAYHHARHPADAPRLVATWLALVTGLAAVGIGVGELVLPHLLAAQSEATLELARLYLLMVLGMLVGDVIYATLLGDFDFAFVNLMRLLQPAAVALAYTALWASGHLSVGTALLATVAAAAVDLAVAGTRLIRRHGLGRPSRTLAGTTLWYGVRAHGSATAGVVNTRLDLAIIPAFLAASSVGLYAVATSVSWIVFTLASALGSLVLPVAARDGERGVAIVVRSLHATLAVGTVTALAIGAVAEIGVRLVYGDEFSGAVVPLWILLPGCVLLAAAGVLGSGLYGLGRPFTAGLTNAVGMVVTVVGLLLFLERWGIVAAAAVSTVSYAAVFLSALVVYCAVSGLRPAELLPTAADLRTLRRSASRVLELRAS
jgi:O-antigen/teichoic acid export membrane protein